MSVQVKICGISQPEALAAALAGGVRFIGFVFYPRSPRFVLPALAAELARSVPTGVRVVGLFVSPDDALLDDVTGQVPLDYLQLHDDEPPERLMAIRSRFALPLIKAFRLGGVADLERVPAFADVADILLFDAPPPADGAGLPGGNGVAFDWRLLAGRSWQRPWMLSGGLNPDNLTRAVAATGARMVDVSSGVEDRPGHKHPALIRAFLATAAALC
ncbi:MAG: phosphoribosylanthranilate isomerase [Rhodospirillaceae bacterium]